jgi:hypothetical protein
VDHGEIIQTTVQGQPVVGMRTFYNNPTGGLEAILLIGGQDHCLLASLDDIGNAPAVEAMIRKHYAASILDYTDEITRKTLPALGPAPEPAASNVIPLAKR